MRAQRSGSTRESDARARDRPGGARGKCRLAPTSPRNQARRFGHRHEATYRLESASMGVADLRPAPLQHALTHSEPPRCRCAREEPFHALRHRRFDLLLAVVPVPTPSAFATSSFDEDTSPTNSLRQPPAHRGRQVVRCCSSSGLLRFVKAHPVSAPEQETSDRRVGGGRTSQHGYLFPGDIDQPQAPFAAVVQFSSSGLD